MIDTLVPTDWRDYELIDSGDGQKLERFGQYIVTRPDPRAIWRRSVADEWKKADARFVTVGEQEEWKFSNPPPSPWTISYGAIQFQLKPTDFRHVGVFPEQAVNWDWISRTINNAPVKVLNLFAYTGGATMASALAGAHVTHVDSSRPSMMWASENAKLANISKEKIRWIQDDAKKFVQREIRRGVKYDGIIMDPPRFGRGANGELWKLEDHLNELVYLAREILTESPLFYLVNAYTADLSSLALCNLMDGVMSSYTGSAESGEIGLKESATQRILPAGIFYRWKQG